MERQRTTGPQALQSFQRAPSIVQDAFLRRVRDRCHTEHAIARRVEELYGVTPRGRIADPPRWDASWDRRARIQRGIENGTIRESTLEREAEALRAIEPVEYAEKLTGEIVPRFRKIHCPLPDHDERTASLHVYGPGGGWYCFGCHKGGGIYDLAAAVWGLDTRGPDFRELHARLMEAFRP